MIRMVLDCIRLRGAPQRPDVTLFVDYHKETHDGKPVIKIVVQKGSSCPYYIASKGMRPSGVYVRQGASSVPATETAILQMIKATGGERYEDIRSLNQELTFVDAANDFKAQNVSFNKNQQKTLGLMNTDGIYTNLGLLLSDQCTHTVKLAVFEGTVKAVFKDRREFSGSLLKQLNDIYEFIDRYNRIRSEINGLRRLDKRDYPPEAVREVLLNALVHREYSFSDSTLISIFEDAVLNLLREKSFITRKDIESALTVSQAMAVRVLKGLLDKNEIRSVGGGKNIRYVLPK